MSAWIRDGGSLIGINVTFSDGTGPERYRAKVIEVLERDGREALRVKGPEIGPEYADEMILILAENDVRLI